MFCDKCGTKIESDEKFCTGCGVPVTSSEQSHIKEVSNNTDQKPTSEKNDDERWWHRLGVVAYVLAHLPLLLIVPLVWSENAERYSTYSKTYYGSDGEAFWYCFLTVVIWLLVLRLIKMSIRYIVVGRKPSFRDLMFF